MANLRVESVYLKEVSLPELLAEILLRNNACSKCFQDIAEGISKQEEEHHDE